MTNEEAIEILTDNWTVLENSRYSNEELYTALFMAISALRNESEDSE